MKKTAYICDRCKREITKTAPIQIYGEYINRDGSEYKNGRCLELEDYHFCSDCADTLFSLIERNCKKGVPAVKNPDFEAAVEEMIATQQKKISTAQKANPGATSHKHGGGPKGLDVGKIHALRKAGWTISKIADEMGCCEASVYNALKKEPKPMDEKSNAMDEEPEEEE